MPTQNHNPKPTKIKTQRTQHCKTQKTIYKKTYHLPKQYPKKEKAIIIETNDNIQQHEYVYAITEITNLKI